MSTYKVLDRLWYANDPAGLEAELNSLGATGLNLQIALPRASREQTRWIFVQGATGVTASYKVLDQLWYANDPQGLENELNTIAAGGWNLALALPFAPREQTRWIYSQTSGGTGGTTTIAVGTTPITGGTSGQVAYDNAGVFGEAANFTIASGNPNVAASGAYQYNGVNALQMITASNDLFLGRSGNLTMTGTDNIAIGPNALAANTTGNYSVAIGTNALQTATTIGQNVAIGYAALANYNYTQGGNVAIGYNSMSGASATTPRNSVGVGQGTLLNSSAAGNVAVGNVALTANTTGVNNVAIGAGALTANTTGGTNVAIGANAMQGVGATAPGNSTAVGYQALLNNNGSNNVALGYAAANNITTGTNNVVIGYNSSAPSATASGQLNIANIIYGTGNTSTGNTVSAGLIGIGVQAPGAVLSIRASTTAAAHLNMAAGATPATPADGDMWYDGTHLNFRHGGTTTAIV
jgi:hypothetical protein